MMSQARPHYHIFRDSLFVLLSDLNLLRQSIVQSADKGLLTPSTDCSQEEVDQLIELDILARLRL